jgi:hypothetical protein
MTRVNITVPDALVGEARAAGINISRIATLALADELDRLAKIKGVEQYLAELEAQYGPIPAEEAAQAAAWAKQLPARGGALSA